MSELKDLSKLVESLLTQFPLLRDNDKALVCKIWEHQLKELGKDINKLTINDFFIFYLSPDINLTNSDTITRARRKKQETIIELRGNLYDKRHNYQDEFKKEILELFKPIKEINQDKIKKESGIKQQLELF